jgi:hypothetical protein
MLVESEANECTVDSYKLTRSSYVILNPCLADAELIPPTRSVLQTAIIH